MSWLMVNADLRPEAIYHLGDSVIPRRPDRILLRECPQVVRSATVLKPAHDQNRTYQETPRKDDHTQALLRHDREQRYIVRCLIPLVNSFDLPSAKQGVQRPTSVHSDLHSQNSDRT